MDKMLGGYQALQIRLLNGRIFQKLLSKEPDTQYRSEQGKNFNDFVEARVGVRYCDRYRSCDGSSQ